MSCQHLGLLEADMQQHGTYQGKLKSCSNVGGFTMPEVHSQARELNPEIRGNVAAPLAPGKQAGRPAAAVVGDGGASWRMKALRRAQAQATEEGSNLSEVGHAHAHPPFQTQTYTHPPAELLLLYRRTSSCCIGCWSWPFMRKSAASCSGPGCW